MSNLSTLRGEPTAILTFEEKTIRVFTAPDGGHWFAIKDICRALHIAWGQHTVKKLKESWRGNTRFFVMEDGLTEIRTVNMAAVYKISNRANRKKAAEFIDWLEAEGVAGSQKPHNNSNGQETPPPISTDMTLSFEDFEQVVGYLGAIHSCSKAAEALRDLGQSKYTKECYRDYEADRLISHIKELSEAMYKKLLRPYVRKECEVAKREYEIMNTARAA